MRIIFSLGHPAHFHLFKNTISKLKVNGHSIKILITDKDILKELLSHNNIEFTVIAKTRVPESIIYKANKLLKSTTKINRIVKHYQPDLMVGCLSQLAYSSVINRVPYIFVGEDDITYTIIQGTVTYPFVTRILAPFTTRVGFFKKKKIGYNGYQKLSYLHPNVFHADKSKLNGIDLRKPYYLVRLVSLNAYHDVGVKGFSETVLDKLIAMLKVYGNVYLSSEKPLGNKYNPYQLPIEKNDIHHLLAFAKIYIGDSQSMAVEAAMLGTPSIRFNDFAGRISVLEELEHKYGLTYGIKTKDSEKLFSTVESLLKTPNLREVFQKRKDLMIKDKIDVSAFMFWLIENYPESEKEMRREGFSFERFK